MNRRLDWAVILARGASTRMGMPKGLCRLPGDSLCFLARILGLYRAEGFPVAVVTTTKLSEDYRQELAPAAPDAWVLRASGGGTAITVVAALETLSERASHIWLHPVDLPSVTSATVGSLLMLSRQRPEAVLVPEHKGRPGHPVVMPVIPFTHVLGDPVPRDMRPWLLALTRPGPRQLAPLLPVELADRGIVADFDDAGSLE